MFPKLQHELRSFVPTAAFFLAAFQLLALTEALMLGEFGIRVPVFLTATISALVVSKVVLLTDYVRLLDRFPTRPRAWRIAWKTAVYFATAVAFRYLEHLFHMVRKTGNLARAHEQLMAEFNWHHFVGVQVWLLVLLLAFCTMRELIRALGRDRMLALFFGDPSPDAPPPTSPPHRPPA